MNRGILKIFWVRWFSRNTIKWMHDLLQLRLNDTKTNGASEQLLFDLMNSYEKTWEGMDYKLDQKKQKERFYDLIE